MSMTIKEAIRALHLPGDHIKSYDEYGYGVDDELKDAMQMAIAALREKAEREDPKPLTLEELRQMDGEPVWLDRAGGIYGLVDVPDRVVWLDRGGCHAIGDLEGIAYRHKPKEVA